LAIQQLAKSLDTEGMKGKIKKKKHGIRSEFKTIDQSMPEQIEKASMPHSNAPFTFSTHPLTHTFIASAGLNKGQCESSCGERKRSSKACFSR